MSNGCVRGYNSVTLNGDEIVLQDAGFTVRTRKSDMSIDSIEAIVADWLTAHGYDGLKSNWDECRCGLENLMHCEDKYDCKPAYRQGEEAMSDNEERLERVMDEAERFIEAAGNTTSKVTSTQQRRRGPAWT